MKLDQVIQFWVYDGEVWQDYTDGVLNCNIIRGCQNYIGPTTQPDVGQLTITSRNTNLDPYENDVIRYSKLVRVTANGERIFTGKIDGIDVEYRPLGEDPIITLTAIDMIGTMQKHILSEDFVQANPSAWTTFYLLQLLDFSDEIPDFINPVRLTTGLNNVSSGIDRNTTAWDALSKRSATDLGFVYADDHNEIYYYRLPIDNALHPNNSRPIKAYFASDGSELSYRTIRLNDGFENIVNSLTLNATTGSWSGSPLVYTTTSSTFQREIEASINLWGKSRNTLDMLSTNSTIATDIADAVFDEMSNPVREVYQISWDASKDPDLARTIDILDNININHQVGNVSINRKYGIIGIQHSITPDDWTITYLVRNWNFKETAMGNPVISVSPTTGDQFTDWTFSFSFDQMDEVASVAWDLDEGFTSTSMSPTVNYVTAGVKHVSLTVTNIYGWEKTATFDLTVGGAPPLNSWTYSLGSANVYQFTFTGQEAASYLWDFGDGTTSTEMNPQKFYVTAGERTVTCYATNAYGTSQSSQTFTPTIVSVLPVRYVQIAPKDFNYLSTDGTTNMQLHYIYVGNNTTNYALNKTMQFENYMGKFLTSGTDTYGRRNQRIDSEVSSLLLDGDPATAVNWYHTMPVIPWNSVDGYDKRVRGVWTIDLGEYYFDVDQIRIYKEAEGNASSYSGTFDAAVSFDGQTWYYVGELSTLGYSHLTYIPITTAAGALPVNFSNPQITLKQNYKPIRYARLKTENSSFKIGEFIGLDGYIFRTATNTSTTGGAARGDFGYGGINATNGSNITNATNSPGVLYGYPSGTYSQGQYLGLKINDKNIATNVYAGGTSNFIRYIDADFGKVKRNIYGFYIDTRDENGVVTTGPTTQVTIEVSEDNVTWTSLGTFNLQSTGRTIIASRESIIDGQGNPQLKYNPITTTGWYLTTYTSS